METVTKIIRGLKYGSLLLLAFALQSTPVRADDDIMSAINNLLMTPAPSYQSIGLILTDSPTLPGKRCIANTGGALPPYVCWSQGVETASGEPFTVWTVDGDPNTDPDYDHEKCDQFGTQHWICFDRNVRVAAGPVRLLSACGDIGQPACANRVAHRTCTMLICFTEWADYGLQCGDPAMFIFKDTCLQINDEYGLVCPRGHGRNLQLAADFLDQADQLMATAEFIFEVYDSDTGVVETLAFRAFLNRYFQIISENQNLSEAAGYHSNFWIRMRNSQSTAQTPFMRVNLRTGYLFRYATSEQAIEQGNFWEPRLGNGVRQQEYSFPTAAMSVQRAHVEAAMTSLYNLTAARQVAGNGGRFQESDEVGRILPYITFFLTESARNVVVQRMAVSIASNWNERVSLGSLQLLFTNYGYMANHAGAGVGVWQGRPMDTADVRALMVHEGIDLEQVPGVAAQPRFYFPGLSGRYLLSGTSIAALMAIRAAQCGGT